MTSWAASFWRAGLARSHNAITGQQEQALCTNMCPLRTRPKSTTTIHHKNEGVHKNDENDLFSTATRACKILCRTLRRFLRWPSAQYSRGLRMFQTTSASCRVPDLSQHRAGYSPAQFSVVDGSRLVAMVCTFWLPLDVLALSSVLTSSPADGHPPFAADHLFSVALSCA